MGRVRRGNYIFVWYIGDHSPPHVLVHKDRRLIVKWDLAHERPLEGAITSKIKQIISELMEEGYFDEILKD